jgi:hypothetical protein
MVRSLHVTLQDLKREQLGPLQDHMEQQLLAVDAKERMAQALLNEGTLIRRLDLFPIFGAISNTDAHW